MIFDRQRCLSLSKGPAPVRHSLFRHCDADFCGENLPVMVGMGNEFLLQRRWVAIDRYPQNWAFRCCRIQLFEPVVPFYTAYEILPGSHLLLPQDAWQPSASPTGCMFLLGLCYSFHLHTEALQSSFKCHQTSELCLFQLSSITQQALLTSLIDYSGNVNTNSQVYVYI